MNTLYSIYTSVTTYVALTFVFIFLLQAVLFISEFIADGLEEDDRNFDINTLGFFRMYYFLLDKILCFPLATEYGEFATDYDYPLLRFFIHLIFTLTWPLWIFCIIVLHAHKFLTVRAIKIILLSEDLTEYQKDKLKSTKKYKPLK